MSGTQAHRDQQIFTFTFDKQPTNVFFDLHNEIVTKQASLVVGLDENNIGEQSFRLEQNYPNPAAGHTTFTYSIPEESEVLMGLFDLAGKKVLDIVNSKQSLGTHVIKADLGGLMAGIYLCRLEAGGRSDVVKVAVR